MASAEVYTDWVANAAVVGGTLLAVSICVLLHYEALSFMSRRLAGWPRDQQRRNVVYGIMGVLLVHIIEIWVFGAAFWLVLQVEGSGRIHGADTLQIFDAVYMAAVTYTTVGFGDLVPQGPIRFMAGMTALSGFVLVTWSASFTFLGMERYWKR
mgnify:CR=1 FL=1